MVRGVWGRNTNDQAYRTIRVCQIQINPHTENVHPAGFTSVRLLVNNRSVAFKNPNWLALGKLASIDTSITTPSTTVAKDKSTTSKTLLHNGDLLPSCSRPISDNPHVQLFNPADNGQYTPGQPRGSYKKQHSLKSHFELCNQA